MSQTLFVALMNPTSPAHDVDFNAWYDSVHLADAFKLPGFETAIRYRIGSSQLFPGIERLAHRYLTVFTIDGSQIDAARQARPGIAESSVEYRSPAFDVNRSLGVVYEPMSVVLTRDTYSNVSVRP